MSLDDMFKGLDRKIDASKKRGEAERKAALKPGFSMGADGKLSYDGGTQPPAAAPAQPPAQPPAAAPSRSGRWHISHQVQPPPGTYWTNHVNPSLSTAKANETRREWDGRSWLNSMNGTPLGGHVHLYWEEP